jgi:hypothetical protein
LLLWRVLLTGGVRQGQKKVVLLADVMMFLPIKFDGLAAEVGQELEVDQAGFLANFPQGSLEGAFPGFEMPFG